MLDVIKTSIASVLLVVSGYFNSNMLPHDDSLIQRQSLMSTETPTVTTLPSPTLKPYIKPKTQPNSNTTNTNTGVNIDCIGPDGVTFKTTQIECDKLNMAWGKTTDSMINCNVSQNCGGGTKYIRKSECDNSTCCQIGSGWYFYLDKNKCTQDQKSKYTYPSQNNINIPYSGSNVSYYPCTIYYPSINKYSTYYYLYKTKAECDSAQSQINTNNTYVIPTTSYSAGSINTNNTYTDCYNQYNKDIQRANSYGGNVGTAMKDMANSNLSRCLSTGNVVAVGNIVSEPSKDRDGKLCSDYPADLKSYSQSMGCP